MKNQKGYLISMLLIILLSCIVVGLQLQRVKIEPIMQYIFYSGIATALFGNLVSFLTYCFCKRKEIRRKNIYYIVIVTCVNILFMGLFWYITFVIHLFS